MFHRIKKIIQSKERQASLKGFDLALSVLEKRIGLATTGFHDHTPIMFATSHYRLDSLGILYIFFLVLI